MPAMSVSSRFGLSRPRLLDRYIVREMLAPTAIGLLVFSFVLLIDQIPRLLAVLVARSADLTTILRVFLNLLPSILAVTIPMAFLLGVLLAFGRLASDSEIVALRAVGVSPLRLLAPVIDYFVEVESREGHCEAPRRASPALPAGRLWDGGAHAAPSRVQKGDL